MKRYIKAEDTSGYNFYVTDCLDEYDSFSIELESKDIPDFAANVVVTAGGPNNSSAIEATDYFNEGDMDDDEFEEIIDENWEYIEDVIADYLYDNELVFMDSRGFTHKIYK